MANQPHITGVPLSHSPVSDVYPNSISTSTQHRPQPSSSGRKTVATTPPWARHEPPLPSDDAYLSPSSAPSNAPRSINGAAVSNDAIHSDIASMTSSGEDPPHSGGWWTFTRRKPPTPSSSGQEPDSPTDVDSPASPGFNHGDPEKDNRWLTIGSRSSKIQTPVRERNRTSWLFGYSLTGGGGSNENKSPKEKSREDEQQQPLEAPAEEEEKPEAGPSNSNSPVNKRTRALRLETPLPGPLTMAQSKTPGWNSPWAPTTKHKLPAPRDAHVRGDSLSGPTAAFLGREQSMGGLSTSSSSSPSTSRAQGGYWKQKRRKWRAFCLYNNYVPLLFRILNLTFTSATLGLAIQMRKIELKHELMGVLGSSPTIAIIFAPPTILHVLIAIYLEYFGRPVGLWRTSAKLAHTLTEVLFICAWSASLSLCFDNYFTSAIQCTGHVSTRWWSELPPLPNPLDSRPPEERYLGSQLCNQQVALICLVFIGLQFYCSNLIISLYRIIEKVKYSSSSSRVSNFV